MAILNITTDITGQIGVTPRIVRVLSNDTFATVTTANYLQNAQTMGFTFYPTDIVAMTYGDNISQFFTITKTNTTMTLVPASENITQPVVAGNLAVFADTAGTLTDNTAALNTVSNTSATPGTVRSITGAMSSSVTTQTSGNLVGIRGSVTCVGASGGFLYGTQGKVIPSGTLSGSVWAAAVFGQFDVSAATINAGQCAAVWGDWGATGATATDLTGCRGFAFTNTTSNVLNAQDYRYGNATYLLELAGAGGTLNYYAAAGTASGSAGNSTHCAAQQVIKIEINGAAAYIPVFTQNT